MSEIKDKLGFLLAKHGVMTGSEWRSKVEALAEQRQAGASEIDTVVPGTVVGDAEDGFYLVRTEFPLDAEHGGMTLGDVLHAVPERLALAACDEEMEDFDAASAVFIDTETTGLAGGTGTVAFLVGAGYFVDDVFRLDQCFMRDFDDEEPILRHLDGIFANCGTVVSYNGKSFDVPLLRTRFIQNRIPFRLDSAVHFDLVHAARRFWKLRLQDCSLGNVERAVLGTERHDDVPSHEIPQLWLDYLRSRDARKLDRVFYHHKTDILSLVTLTARLSQALAGPEGEGFDHVEDRLSLVRVYFRQKRFEDVLSAADRLLESETNTTLRADALGLLAHACKRLQQWTRMESALTLLLDEAPRDLTARLELAKLYEHRLRNLPQAESVCVETLTLLETRVALDRDLDIDSDHVIAFEHRLTRIRRKLRKM
jgi:uncharacterized protein